jgi:hypothetical protein
MRPVVGHRGRLAEAAKSDLRGLIEQAVDLVIDDAIALGSERSLHTSDFT